jgi:arsenical pump membrane protein
VPEGLGLALSLGLLAATLAAAASRAAYLSETVAASAGAVALVAAGALGLSAAGHALHELAPTVGFLAALLVIGDGARREGLFEALGELLARRSRGSPRRLLALVFAVATAVTALLGLDATAVLLTPIVFATATRLRLDPRPHVYASGHLSNAASLLLPISNLTNLLVLRSSRLSFAHFAALMALPTLGAVAVEWVVLRRSFAPALEHAHAPAAGGGSVEAPRAALVLLAILLAGFALSSVIGVAPVWVAAAGAVAFALRGLLTRATRPSGLVRALEPGFLLFVLGLGVIVAAAAHEGLAPAVRSLVPAGGSLLDLLAVAALAAVLANLVNNLPATLILMPAALAAGGRGALLAVLVGVNVGPNLTFVGSLATLLWRRVLHAEDVPVGLGQFVRLGALAVPPALALATVLLWSALQI